MSSSTSTTPYTPPSVWVNDADPASSLNRPTAGARENKALPVGVHPIQLYSMATPNGQKVTIMLEELLEIGKDCEYDAWPINIGKGDQFGSDFVGVNPNSKIPAMRIMESDGATTKLNIFESGSILLYLAETFDAFIPKDPIKRTETLSWLFWQMGSAPVLGGGFGHFFAYAPEKFKYPIDRFAMEAKRQLDVLDKQLASNQYISGDDYTIADIAIFPWYGGLVLGRSYAGAATFLNVSEEYPNVIRWAEMIADRPAVKRGVIVNRMWGDEQLPERHSSDDFKDKVIRKI